ncbi:hypothetical protein L915_06984, partial [Phytophthora nicotianae]
IRYAQFHLINQAMRAHNENEVLASLNDAANPSMWSNAAYP